MAVTNGPATVSLPTHEQILVTREFGAPKHLVYRAWTTPDLVRRWWSGRRGEMKVVDIDLRVGGMWRYVMVAHGDFEVAFHGEFREIVPDERLVYTEVFEGAPAAADVAPSEPPLDTVTFAPSETGGTALTILVECHTKALRDLILESGMEAGVQGQMEALEEVARSLK
jgi:uncharacterized protein YndB with AHSA1/START domain